MVKLREQLKSNIIKVNHKYTQFSIRNIIDIHLLANNISSFYYFAIFSRKFFSLYLHEEDKCNLPPWSESNGGINHNWLNNIAHGLVSTQLW